MKYIDAEKLIAEIEKWSDGKLTLSLLTEIKRIIVSLQQEQPDEDLDKLGEIARHIIAVKQNVEDMRLSEDEWSLLERIGYPQRLNARKEK